MSDGTASVDAIWDALTESIAAVAARFRPLPLPPCLYHYGTAQGLLSVVASQCFWATDANYLNDATELSYAISAVNRLVQTKEREAEGGTVREFLSRLRHDWTGTHLPAVFVVSFSEGGDILSQWRSYGGITGYAIGLGTEWWQLYQVETTLRLPSLRLRRVLYAEEEQQVALTSLLDAACASLIDAERRSDGEEFQEFELRVRSYLCAVLTLLAACLKHPSFAEEREWRFIYMQDADPGDQSGDRLPVHFRAAELGLIPYVELRLPATDGPYAGRLPITEVFHGPSERPELTVAALQRFVRQHGYVEPHTRVRGSSAPLRKTR
jgi:hypothetical protein